MSALKGSAILAGGGTGAGRLGRSPVLEVVLSGGKLKDCSPCCSMQCGLVHQELWQSQGTLDVVVPLKGLLRPYNWIALGW